MSSFTHAKKELLLSLDDTNLRKIRFLRDYGLANEIQLEDVSEVQKLPQRVSIEGKTKFFDGDEKASTETVFLSYHPVTDELLEFEIVQDTILNLPVIPSVSFSNYREHISALFKEEGRPAQLERIVKGDLEIGTASPVQFNLEEYDDRYDIRIDWPETGPDLADLANLIGSAADLQEDWIPQELKTVVSIDYLVFKIGDHPDESGREVKTASAGFKFGPGKTWEIIPGLEWLNVGSLWGDLDVDYPLSKAERFATFRFGGSIFIGSPGNRGEITIESRWPDLAITGKLKEGDRIPLGQLLSEVGIPLIGDSGGEDPLSVSALYFSAEPLMEKRSFSFGLTVDDVWVLRLSGQNLFSLDQISVDLRYQESDDSNETTGSFSASMHLAGKALFASAKSDGDGWQISAFTNDEIDIFAWVQQFRPLFKLPPGLTDLKLGSFSIEYHTGTGAMSITGSSSGQLDMPGIEASVSGLKFKIDRSQDDIWTVALEGVWTIGDYPISLTGDKAPDGWQLNASSHSRLELTEYISKVAGSGFEELPGIGELRLEYFSSSYHTGTKDFSITAQTETVISILMGKANLDIALKDFSFRNEEKTNVEIIGTCELDLEGSENFGFDVSLNFESGEDQEPGSWKIEGRSSGSLDIGKLTYWIKSKFKTDVKTPELLESEGNVKAGLKEVYFSVDIKPGSESEFKFGGKCDFELFEKSGEIQVGIELIKEGKSKHSARVLGELVLFEEPAGSIDHRFSLLFAKEKDSKYMAARYQGELTLKQLVQNVFGQDVENIPEWLSPSLDEAVFVLRKEEAKTEAFLGIKIEPGEPIDLSNLEFAGKFIQREEDKRLAVGLDIFLCSKEVKKAEVKKLQGAFDSFGAGFKISEIGMRKGLTVETEIKAPIFGENLKLPVTGGAGTGEDDPSKTKWQPVPKDKKKLGPVFIEKVGLTMEDGKVKVLLDGGMEMGGNSFTLLGFGVKVPIKPSLDALSDVDFGLDGLSLDIQKGDVRISGGFYRQILQLDIHGDGNVRPYTGYVGEIRAKLNPTKTITAYGGYVNLEGTPSFFIYAVAELPIGGPAEFFIDGFAGGFGLNSSLNIPDDIAEVRDFIMVKAAFGDSFFEGENQSVNLSNIFHEFPPSLGNHWIAIGIKANHYKFVESFLLAAVSFGEKLKLDILGLARINMPKGAESLARVEIAMRAQFVPDDGILAVEGRISEGSYVLNPMAKLSGGFAFYTWLKGEHEGDFVITVGGYHPAFKKPSHYPDVPRLALNYQVSSNIYLKGSAYIALTPKMLMAGGRLEGMCDLDNIKAWFVLDANFLVNFKPFQYYIDAAIALGCEFSLDIGICTIRKTIQVGARMELWGPDFGGLAVIDLDVVEFEIEFGEPRKLPAPISWREFHDGFLPPAQDLAKISISEGVIKEFKSEEFGPANVRYLVSPTDLRIAVESSIPSKSYELNYLSQRKEIEEVDNWEVGIAPMNLSPENFSPKLLVEFRGESGPKDKCSHQAHQGRVPAALWGKYRDTGLNGPMLIGTGDQAPYKGLEFKPEKDVGDRLPEKPVDYLSVKDLLTPEVKPVEVSVYAVNDTDTRLNEDDFDGKGMRDLLGSPNSQILDSLRELKDFEHLPNKRDISIETMTDTDLDQFEDGPLLNQIGAQSRPVIAQLVIHE